MDGLGKDINELGLHSCFFRWVGGHLDLFKKKSDINRENSECSVENDNVKNAKYILDEYKTF